MTDNTQDPAVGKFIGTSKVVMVARAEGIPLVAFSLENGRRDDCTEEQFDSQLSDEAYDDGEVSVRKWQPAINQMTQVLLDSNLEMVDKEFVIGQLDSKIVESYNQAIAYILGVDHPFHTSLQAVDTILRKRDAEKAAAVAPTVTPVVAPEVTPPQPEEQTPTAPDAAPAADPVAVQPDPAVPADPATPAV